MAGRKVALDYTHNVSRKISFIPPPEGTFSKNFAKAIFSALINSAHALPFRKLSELKSIFWHFTRQICPERDVAVVKFLWVAR